MNKSLTLALLFVFLPSAVPGQDNKSLELMLDKARKNADMELLLSDILLNALQPYKCVTIICDDVYYDIFEEKLFKQFGVYISFIVILVQETEDLLAPFESTQEALMMAKTQGCQFYIILIANGIQVTRLLRFGDRYRVLNTRSNYLMLWDRRLFDRDLHFIWKRIINIVFIREYGGIKKTGSIQKAIPWFEISTVPFPSPIKGIFIPRRLDIWRQSKFRTGADLFRDKTLDLKNQTLRVVTFSHIPATSKMNVPEYKTVRTVMNSGSVGFTGIEIEVLKTISVAMNFVPDLYETVNADIELWGEKQPDGQYSGMLGEMVKSLADIALGDLPYTPYFLKLMDLSIPYNTECLTFLTPESLTNNSWKTLILPFTPLMWSIILVCLMLIGFIFYALSRFHDELNKIMFRQARAQKHAMRRRMKGAVVIVQTLNVNEKYILMKMQYRPSKMEGEPEGLYLFGNLSNSILYTFGMILLISLPKLPTGWSIRMLTGWYWLYCILLVVAYKASMTAILANPAPRVTIDTIQELVDSEIPCGGWGEINREFFKTSLDPISKVIGSKFETINDSDSAIDRVARGSFALYENAHFLKETLVKKQMKYQMLESNKSGGNEPEKNARGDHNLHIMSDCVIHMPISIGLQKNSPIKPRVDKFIRRVFEAGLIKKWLDDVMLPTINAEINYGPKDVIKALMNMEKLFGAVVALFIGYFISIVALLAETLYFEFVTKKNPNFDKYSRQIFDDPSGYSYHD